MHRVQSRNGEGLDQDRIAFLDLEGDLHILRSPLDQGIDDGVGESTTPIKDAEANHIPAEFLLVKVPLGPEAHPAQKPSGKPARIRSGDCYRKYLVGESAVALERELAHHPVSLLRRYSRRGCQREETRRPQR